MPLLCAGKRLRRNFAAAFFVGNPGPSPCPGFPGRPVRVRRPGSGAVRAMKNRSENLRGAARGVRFGFSLQNGGKILSNGV